jgi:L-cysteine desulfidase
MHPGGGGTVMDKKDCKYQKYIELLRKELVPAMGCTEPIAIAFGAAKAREVLGGLPDKTKVAVSRNIVKNVKSVVIPNTNGLKGIDAAVAAGIAAGDADKQLEVIAAVPEEKKGEIKTYLESHPIEVETADGDLLFDIQISMWKGKDQVKLRISRSHTNIVLIEKNGEVLFQHEAEETGEEEDGVNLLTVRDIVDFAESVDIKEIEPYLEPQMQYNYAIAEEGIRGGYGANIGKVLLDSNGNDVKIRAKAMAAAGSDARMSGCELPVVILTGSGNQGIAASVPVIVYARELGSSREELLRALAVSDLITIHQRSRIGKLSAYCGAVNAGCASGTGIAYLQGGRFPEIAHTIVNALAMVSGMICDGAKPSCAAKIAISVEAGILGFLMYQQGQQFRGGDGIVTKGVDETIYNVGRLGRDGMRETDKEIVDIMMGCCSKE